MTYLIIEAETALGVLLIPLSLKVIFYGGLLLKCLVVFFELIVSILHFFLMFTELVQPALLIERQVLTHFI